MIVFCQLAIHNPCRAVRVNIEIMRVFFRLRQMLATHKALARKLSELELHLQDHDEQIQAIFEAIRQLMTSTERPQRLIGFQLKEHCAKYKTGKGVMKITKP